MFDIGLYLVDIRLILSIIFLIIAWSALFGLVIIRNYWKKIFLLAVFITVLFYLFYIRFLHERC